MNTDTTTPTPPTILQRALSSLWSGAVADAIGNRLEFLPEVSPQAFMAEVNRPTLDLTDDTQMTLFLWESLLNGTDSQAAYSRWFVTQTRTKAIPSNWKAAPAQGLLGYPSLYRREAPGSTCLNSLYDLTRGRRVDNDSKGNGTVMRCSPFAFWGRMQGISDATARDMAGADAFLTHKHSYASASSIMLTSIIQNMLSGDSLTKAVETAVCPSPYVRDLVLSMGLFAPWQVIRARRAGWVAEEALAMAVGAAMRGETFLQVVELACNAISCDSDTIASIAGQLASLNGMEAPTELRAKLGAYDAVHHIETKLVQFDDHPMTWPEAN